MPQKHYTFTNSHVFSEIRTHALRHNSQRPKPLYRMGDDCNGCSNKHSRWSDSSPGNTLIPPQSQKTSSMSFLQNGNLAFLDGRCTLNSRLATSSLGRLVKGEEWWEAHDHPQGALPQNWVGNELNHSVTCMVLKTTANVRHHLALCHDEFRGP
ncbi:uncharacterized protein TNCV_5067661 [Trichonephila clavipes]|uniref:Uncharacterized protein n=1 Tax=Trichonephila clavipes TaxID=2585209 RepID=A0A8X6RD37_TRICX|nr:uncharacterized protein TNCV_5067661 [Trichonephila clavipes]